MQRREARLDTLRPAQYCRYEQEPTLGAVIRKRPRKARQSDVMISRMSWAVELGVLPTCTPTFSSASFFAAAVPDEPETIAPACPIVLPSGAVKPATYPTTGLVTYDSINAAARSSASPPISPIITMASVSGSS